MNLIDQVTASLTRYSMLLPGDRVGIAVSGGADSVALLHVLHSFSQYEITVLHVNHHLRGLESDEDQNFVRLLAADLGLPFEARSAPIGAGNMEQLARDARRAFFFEARDRLNLRRIALGHNQSDQAETVLYRFLRGAGLSGLAGMSPVSPEGIIRPMLHVTREAIRDWAAGRGIVWREDSSNQNLEITRNRLRLEVLNPQLVQVLSANASVARDEEDWWTARTGQLFSSLACQSPLGLQMTVSALNDLHAAEQRRVIRQALREVKGDLRSIDLSHVEAVRDLLRSEAAHDRVQVPGVDALRSFGTLLLAPPGQIGSQPRHYQMFVEIDKELALPYSGGRLYVNWIKQDHRFCGNFGVDTDSNQEVTDFDGESLSQAGRLDELHIRNWEPGDEYCRAGHAKPEKIKSLFQEYRIVLWERRRWPVMLLGDQIIWSPGFGAAAKFQSHVTSRAVLRLVYEVESV